MGGYGFSRPVWRMQIESPSGYGLAERICIVVNKKETTWCVALAEHAPTPNESLGVGVNSQIKYSPASF